METKETIESLNNKLTGASEQLKTMMEGLNKKTELVKSLFDPLKTKKGLINKQEVNITLSKKGAIIINFVTLEEAEKYYNKLK